MWYAAAVQGRGFQDDEGAAHHHGGDSPLVIRTSITWFPRVYLPNRCRFKCLQKECENMRK